MAENESNTDITKIDGNTEMAGTESNTDITKIDGNTEMAETESNIDITKIDGNTEMAETESNTDITKTEENTEMAETESNTEITKTEENTEMTETESSTEITKTEENTEMAENESNTDITKTEENTEMAKTESNTDITKTEENTEINENTEKTDKLNDNYTQNQTETSEDSDILSVTNKISEKDETDGATTNYNENEKGTDTLNITNKKSDNYDTDESSEIIGQTEKNMKTEETNDMATENNNLSEVNETEETKETDKATNNDVMKSDEFTHKEITNEITEIIECSFDEIVGNNCNGKITNNQINDVYNYIKEKLIQNNSSTVIKTDNTIFQITPIDLQKDLNDPNISNVDLGKCEMLLKRKNNISDEESLIIFKIDMKQVEQYSTYVQYEIYNPKTLKTLNLSACDNVLINIYPPVRLDEETLSIFSHLDKSGYNLFNSSDAFYNDFCTPYTTKNGTDMILGDRQKEIYGKNGKKALCQTGCTLDYFNQTTNKAKCNCQVQKSESNLDITNLKNSKVLLEESFLNTLTNSNFQIIRCYKLVIDFSTFFENIGRIIMTILIFIIIVLFILYCIFGYKKLNKFLTDIINQKVSNENKNKISNENENKISNENENKILNDSKKNQKSNSTQLPYILINNRKRATSIRKGTHKNTKKKTNLKDSNNAESKRKIQNIQHNGKKNERISLNNRINNNENSKENLQSHKRHTSKLKTVMKNDRKEKKNKTYNNVNRNHKAGPPRKRMGTIRDNKNSSSESIEKAGTSHTNINSKNDIRKMNKKHRNTVRNKKINKPSTLYNNIKEEKIKKTKTIDHLVFEETKKFTNQELNNLVYKEALKYDKRTYLQYYWSLIKQKQLILFTLINDDDYNLIIIKAALFLLSFSLYLTINAFFFSDETMHVIYETNGIYNFISQLPKIFYSTMVTAVINMILKNLSLSEANMLKIKKEKKLPKARKMSRKVLTCIQFKTAGFFALSFLLMFFFWYYISCFCAVYKNTQKILINDTLISFGLSMVYPFGLNLLPGIFRITALKSKKKDKECLYKTSLFVALI
jgi:chemotaxis protein histidine kinase CheA